MNRKRKISIVIIILLTIIILLLSIRGCQKNNKENSNKPGTSFTKTTTTSTKTSSSVKKKDEEQSGKKDSKGSNKEVMIVDNGKNAKVGSTTSTKEKVTMPSGTKPTSSSSTSTSSTSTSSSTSDSKPDNKVYAFESEFKTNYLKWSNLQAQGLIEEKEYTTDMDEVAKSFRIISKETEKKKNKMVLTKEDKELYQFYGELAKDIEDLSKNISNNKYDQADKTYEKIQNKEERFKKGETT